jgi:hypothetical protein
VCVCVCARVCVCVCVCPLLKSKLLDQSWWNLARKYIFKAGRFLAGFWACTPTPWDQGGPKRGPGCLCSLNRPIWQKLYTTKVVGHTCLVGANHICGSIIWIWKDPGSMCFWSHGQSFSNRVYKTKVVVHLTSSQLGQVWTPTPIPFPLPRVRGPKMGSWLALQPQPTYTAMSKWSEARMWRGKIADILI